MTQNTPEIKPERVAKIIARSGHCSRRKAEELILTNKVRVNGEIIRAPGTTVTPADAITINGVPLAKPEPTKLWMLNKLEATITASSDPQGRATVFDNLPLKQSHIVAVGRLDYNTEGLLLLTNDGELAQKLAHPSSAWDRTYRVRAFGFVPKEFIKAVSKPFTVKDIQYRAWQVEEESTRGKNTWFRVTICEGKNREIRKVFTHFGLEVNRLIRVQFGPYILDDLQPGAVKRLDLKLLDKRSNGPQK